MSNIVISVTGDALATQRLPRNEQGLVAIHDLLQASDVRFTNLETTIHNYEDDVYPAAHSGGDWIVAPPAVLADLKWLGFNMMSFANNHTLDWSHGGLLKTIEHLDREEIVHAGVGSNLSEASRPKYYETAQGRVAIIGVNSTFRDWHIAGQQRRDVIGRPGLNPLGYQTIHKVTEDKLEQLKEIAEQTGINVNDANGANPYFRFGQQLFEIGEPGTRTEMNEMDAKRIEASIREAVRQADVVLVSHHSHEMKGRSKEQLTDFQREFAHRCIDAGAHAYIAHGPHVLRGIEIYKNRPVFHGLGDFIFQSPLLEKQPAEFYELYDLGYEHSTADGFDVLNQKPDVNEQNHKCFESVIATFEVADGSIAHVTLHPITLRFDLPRSRRGWPMLASAGDSAKILEELQRLSAPFGTTIEAGGIIQCV